MLGVLDLPPPTPRPEVGLSLPAPEAPKEKKIIALGLGRYEPLPANYEAWLMLKLTGRNGTLGLYHTFQILGYRPYHFVTCFARGISHTTLVVEGLKPKYFGEGQPFGRAEFDKWFADYDVREPNPPGCLLLMTGVTDRSWRCRTRCSATYRPSSPQS